MKKQKTFMITLDYDYITHKKLLSILNVLKGFKRVNKIWYRFSSSKKGYHIMIEYLNIKVFNDLDVDVLKIGMRYALNDDVGRIRADTTRYRIGMGVMRLFYCKNNRFAGEWKVFK